MGVGGSGPAHAAEVQLELPEARCPPGLYFFARLHTAANGHVKYKAWGQPQTLGLFPDDIIMVSIHSAQSEAHFDTDNCEDVGELYMPWEDVQIKLTNGEGTFRLGTSRGSKSLGLNATPNEYQESFVHAQGLSQDSKATQVLVRIKRLPDPVVATLPGGSGLSPRSQAPVIRTPQTSPRSQRRVAAPISHSPNTLANYVPPVGNGRHSVQLPPQRISSAAAKASAETGDAPKSPMRGAYRPVSPLNLNSLNPPSFGAAQSKQPSNTRMVSSPFGTPAPPQSAPVVRTAGTSVEAPRANAAVPKSQPKLSTPTRQFSSGGSPLRYFDERRGSTGSAVAQRPSTSPSLASYGMEELGTEDMRLLRQIQVQNQRLRQQLGLREDEELPEVGEKMQTHIDRLQKDVYENFALLEKLQKADKDLAMINASLSKEDRLALTAGGGFAVPSSVASVGMQVEDEADVRRRTEGMMTEIQEVTQANIKLIKEYDEQTKLLEKDLHEARRQHQQLQKQVPQSSNQLPNGDDDGMLQNCKQELQALKLECQSLQDFISQESEKKRETDLRTIQKLETEKEVFVEEIEKLRHSLDKDQEDEAPMQIPATGVLSAEADKLRGRLQQERDRGQQEQDSLDLQIADLRRQTKGFEEELEHVEEEKQRVQDELQELRMSRDDAKAIERERNELQQTKDNLTHAATRSRSMIQVYDEKIAALRQETDDIRVRVDGVSSSSVGGSFERTPVKRLTARDALATTVPLLVDEASFAEARSAPAPLSAR